MIIQRRHPITGKINTLDLPVTQEQMERYLSNIPAQRAFPQLDDDEREFIISGLLPGEFDRLFDDSDT